MFPSSALNSWKRKHEDCVSKYSIKSEYRAMSQAFAKIHWLLGLLVEFGFSPNGPTSPPTSNTSVIHILVTLIFHEHTKHIKVKCHFIYETFEAQTVSLPHVSSNLQVTNIFSMVLTR